MAILLFRPASTAHTGYTMAFLPSRYYLHTHIQDLHISNKNNSNKTISDGGITVDFSIIKVHTSN